MAKLMIEADTESGEMSVSVNGDVLQNVYHAAIMNSEHSGIGFEFCIQETIDDDVAKRTTIHGPINKYGYGSFYKNNKDVFVSDKTDEDIRKMLIARRK